MGRIRQAPSRVTRRLRQFVPAEMTRTSFIRAVRQPCTPGNRAAIVPDGKAVCRNRDINPTCGTLRL